jgi:hypothetical protein
MKIEEIKKRISPILKKHDVKKSSIFGSVARKEDKKDSDVDILIEFRKNSNKGLLEIVALKLALEKELNKKVDVVEYSSIKPLLKKSILKDQISIL